MAIAAKRFQFLTQDTNLASSTFGAGKLDDIINSAVNEFKTVGEDAENLIRTSFPEEASLAKNIYSSAKDSFEEYSRDIKSIAGKLTDYKGAPENLVNELVKSFTSNTGGSTAVAKSAMDMMRRCGRGSSYGFGGRPYDLSASCSGGKASLGRYGTSSGCNSAGYTDLLNKLTGGAYNTGFRDITSGLRSLMALSGYGYKLGLCGVFSGLYSSKVFDALGLTNLEYGKAAGNLLGIMGAGGNVRGWIDVAKGSTGLNPALTNPASLDELLGNLEIPEGVGEIDQVELMRQLRGGQELYDEDWMHNEEGMLSMGHLNGVSSDYSSLSDVWLTDRSFGQNDLDAIPDSDDSFLSAAVVASEEFDFF